MDARWPPTILSPIFELSGKLNFDPSEVDWPEPEVLVALSWYAFTTNSPDPALALASQTIIPRDGDGTFELALQQVPPPSAFVVTGAGRFLELPAEGNPAIGFITVSPFGPTRAMMSSAGKPRPNQRDMSI